VVRLPSLTAACSWCDQSRALTGSWPDASPLRYPSIRPAGRGCSCGLQPEQQREQDDVEGEQPQRSRAVLRHACPEWLARIEGLARTVRVCLVHPRTTCDTALLSRSTNTKTTGLPDKDALTRRATGSSAPATEESKKSPMRPSLIAPTIAPRTAPLGKPSGSELSRTLARTPAAEPNVRYPSLSGRRGAGARAACNKNSNTTKAMLKARSACTQRSSNPR
jgi:hypothetical protein